MKNPRIKIRNLNPLLNYILFFVLTVPMVFKASAVEPTIELPFQERPYSYPGDLVFSFSGATSYPVSAGQTQAAYIAKGYYPPQSEFKIVIGLEKEGTRECTSYGWGGECTAHYSAIFSDSSGSNAELDLDCELLTRLSVDDNPATPLWLLWPDELGMRLRCESSAESSDVLKFPNLIAEFRSYSHGELIYPLLNNFAGIRDSRIGGPDKIGGSAVGNFTSGSMYYKLTDGSTAGTVAYKVGKGSNTERFTYGQWVKVHLATDISKMWVHPDYGASVIVAGDLHKSNVVLADDFNRFYLKPVLATVVAIDASGAIFPLATSETNSFPLSIPLDPGFELDVGTYQLQVALNMDDGSIWIGKTEPFNVLHTDVIKMEEPNAGYAVSYLVDLGTPYLSTGYVTNVTDYSTYYLVDGEGNTGTVTTKLSNFSSINNGGLNQASGDFQANALRDSYYVSGSASGRMNFSGLQPNTEYTVTLVASRSGNDSGRGRVGLYTLSSEGDTASGTLDASDNTQTLVLKATTGSAGQLNLDVKIDPASQSRYAYLNAVKLETAGAGGGGSGSGFSEPVLIDFGSPNYAATNSLGANESLTTIYGSLGGTSGYSVITAGWNSINTSGSTTASTASAPNSAWRDSIYVSGKNVVGTVTLTGLEPSGTYSIEIGASRSGNDSGYGRYTTYEIVGGAKATLDASDNTNRTVTLNGQADSTGQLVLKSYIDPSSSSRYGYLGWLLITPN